MKSFLNYVLASLLLILCAVSSYGQKFDRYKDRVNECNVIKYFDSDFQIIIEKISPFDSTQATYFKIGLYVIKVNVPIDLFMKNGVIISFVDGSKIKIKDQISWLYYGNDSNQLFVTHKLDASELELLCTKQIDYFLVIDYAKEFDKWQSADLLKAFQKLRIEK
jgi:hypothetical protein